MTGESYLGIFFMLILVGVIKYFAVKYRF